MARLYGWRRSFQSFRERHQRGCRRIASRKHRHIAASQRQDSLFGIRASLGRSTGERELCRMPQGAIAASQ